jgi:hypothetical protein
MMDNDHDQATKNDDAQLLDTLNCSLSVGIYDLHGWSEFALCWLSPPPVHRLGLSTEHLPGQKRSFTGRWTGGGKNPKVLSIYPHWQKKIKVKAKQNTPIGLEISVNKALLWNNYIFHLKCSDCVLQHQQKIAWRLQKKFLWI